MKGLLMLPVLKVLLPRVMPVFAGAIGGIIAVWNPLVFNAFCNGFAGLL